MKEDSVVAFRQPGSFSDDPLTDILRAGARQLLGQAIEAEVEAHTDDRSWLFAPIHLATIDFRLGLIAEVSGFYAEVAFGSKPEVTEHRQARPLCPQQQKSEAECAFLVIRWKN